MMRATCRSNNRLERTGSKPAAQPAPSPHRRRVLHVTRRELEVPVKARIPVLVLIVATLLMPLASEAQQARKVYRLAFLGSTSPSGYASQLKAFRGGLRDLGYVE